MEENMHKLLHIERSSLSDEWDEDWKVITLIFFTRFRIDLMIRKKAKF